MLDECIPLNETGEIKPLKKWIRKNITLEFKNGIIEKFQNYIISYHRELITLTDEEYHTITYSGKDIMSITETEITRLD